MLPKTQPKSPTKPGPRIKSETERERVTEYASQKDRQGWNQFDIMRGIKTEFGIDYSQASVSILLKKVRERYREKALRHHEELVGETYDQINSVLKEAYEAWEKSKDGMERTQDDWAMVLTLKEPSPKGRKPHDVRAELEKKMELVKQRVIKEGKAGASEFLNVILACLKAKRELFGLDEAIKVDVNLGLNWDSYLHSGQGLEKPKDPLQEAIDNPAGQGQLVLPVSPVEDSETPNEGDDLSSLLGGEGDNLSSPTETE